MEKLIELLNEYTKKEKFGIIWKLGEDPIGVYGYVNDKYGLGWASKLVIISNEYGFIKWLVENDKIDLVKVKDNSELYIKYGSNKSEKDAIVDIILILLSIQEQPIEFLISVLK